MISATSWSKAVLLSFEASFRASACALTPHAAQSFAARPRSTSARRASAATPHVAETKASKARTAAIGASAESQRRRSDAPSLSLSFEQSQTSFKAQCKASVTLCACGEGRTPAVVESKVKLRNATATECASSSCKVRIEAPNGVDRTSDAAAARAFESSARRAAALARAVCFTEPSWRTAAQRCCSSFETCAASASGRLSCSSTSKRPLAFFFFSFCEPPAAVETPGSH
mmetsp:Transcript_10655/g.35353  ORF Transcript_10655/g.35353 Transcript_10655/m.35353 type:complete len:230 (+) Transcript_10655:87-776(+)